MASIKPIDSHSVGSSPARPGAEFLILIAISQVHQIQSGQVIVDLCSVAKELVENSIDSGATTIGEQIPSSLHTKYSILTRDIDILRRAF